MWEKDDRPLGFSRGADFVSTCCRSVAWRPSEGAVRAQYFDVEGINLFGVDARAAGRLVEKAEKVVSSEPLPPTKAPMPLAPPPPTEMDEGTLPVRPPIDPWLQGIASLQTGAQQRDLLQHQVERLRRELIILLGSRGGLPPPARPWSDYSLFRLVDELSEGGTLSRDMAGAMLQVSEAALGEGPLARHMPGAASAIALRLADHVAALPRDLVRVMKPDVTVFTRRDLVDPFGTRGLMIEILSPTGKSAHTAVFPTLDTSRTLGAFVSWEWETGRGIRDPAWYPDPQSGEPREAWRSASLFAGRKFPRDWQVGQRVAEGTLKDDIDETEVK